MRIEVAAVQFGSTSVFLPNSRVDPTLSPSLAWADRATAVLELSTRKSLCFAIDQGVEALGLRFRPDQWYSEIPLSQTGVKPMFGGNSDLANPVEPLDLILNQDGSAQWWYDPSIVALGAVNRYVEAGTFLGDPGRLVVATDEPPPPGGNGHEFWLEVQEALPYVEAYLAAVGVYGSIAGAYRGMRKLIKKMRAAWYPTGSTIEGYQRLFRLPHTTRQIAVLAKFHPDDVPILAAFLGLREVDGAWRSPVAPSRDELRDLLRTLDRVAGWALSPEERKEVMTRVLAERPGARADAVDGFIRQVLFESREGT